jgi:hypothetical protein
MKYFSFCVFFVFFLGECTSKYLLRQKSLVNFKEEDFSVNDHVVHRAEMQIEELRRNGIEIPPPLSKLNNGEILKLLIIYVGASFFCFNFHLLFLFKQEER